MAAFAQISQSAIVERHPKFIGRFGAGNQIITRKTRRQKREDTETRILRVLSFYTASSACFIPASHQKAAQPAYCWKSDLSSALA